MLLAPRSECARNMPKTDSKSGSIARATCSMKWRRGSHAPERAPPWLTRVQAQRHALPRALLLHNACQSCPAHSSHSRCRSSLRPVALRRAMARAAIAGRRSSCAAVVLPPPAPHSPDSTATGSVVASSLVSRRFANRVAAPRRAAAARAALQPWPLVVASWPCHWWPARAKLVPAMAMAKP